jgi:hypothetical protein
MLTRFAQMIELAQLLHSGGIVCWHVDRGSDCLCGVADPGEEQEWDSPGNQEAFKREGAVVRWCWGPAQPNLRVRFEARNETQRLGKTGPLPGLAGARVLESLVMRPTDRIRPLTKIWAWTDRTGSWLISAIGRCVCACGVAVR